MTGHVDLLPRTASSSTSCVYKGDVIVGYGGYSTSSLHGECVSLDWRRMDLYAIIPNDHVLYPRIKEVLNSEAPNREKDKALTEILCSIVFDNWKERPGDFIAYIEMLADDAAELGARKIKAELRHLLDI